MPTYDSTVFRDTSVRADAAQTPFGSDSTLYVSCYEYGTRRFSLLDWTGLPAGLLTSVSDATLRLNSISIPTDFPQGPFGVRAIDRTWSEPLCSWQIYDGTHWWERSGGLGLNEVDQTPMATFSVDGTGDIAIPLNAYGCSKVMGLINAGTWRGLVIDSTSFVGQWDGMARFKSGNHSDAADRPRLTFTYS